MKLKLFALISILFLVSCGRSGSTDIDPTAGKIKPLKVEMAFTADKPIYFTRAFATPSLTLYVNGEKVSYEKELSAPLVEYTTKKETVTTTEHCVMSYVFTNTVNTPTKVSYSIKIYLGSELTKEITKTVILTETITSAETENITNYIE